MGILKETKRTYEFSINSITELIMKDLEITHNTHNVEVSFIKKDVSNERFDTHPIYDVTGIQVEVSPKSTSGGRD